MTAQKFINYITVALYMIVLCFGSLAPAGSMPGDGTSLARQIFHNFLHIPAYAGLTYLWVSYLGPKTGRVARKTLFISAGIAMAYGILMEYLQSFTPDRQMSLMDVGLNAIGVGIVVISHLVSSPRKGLC